MLVKNMMIENCHMLRPHDAMKCNANMKSRSVVPLAAQVDKKKKRAQKTPKTMRGEEF
jgi:hypothetical protein